MKKRIIISMSSLLSLFVCLVLLIHFIPKNEKQSVSFISDYLWKNYTINQKEISKSLKTNSVYNDYTYSSLTTTQLLRYLQEDTTKISTTNLSLHQQIKSAKYIILSIGMNDFIEDIKVYYQKQKLVYDKDILSLHADIFINQYQQIIEDILLINEKTTIIATSLYYPYPYLEDYELISFFDLINKDVKEILTNENGVYIDISSYSQEKYLDSLDDYKLNTIALNNIIDRIINLDSLNH